MHRVPVQVRVDGYRGDPHLSASSYDPDGNFTAVGYQHFLKHLPNVDIVNGQRRTLDQEISNRSDISQAGARQLGDLGYRLRGTVEAGEAGFSNDDGLSFAVWHATETGSTNADLGAVAKETAASGLVLITDHQRSGRGRQRRTWVDRPGSALLSSVYWDVSTTTLPLLPLVVGLAVADAVEEVAVSCGVDDPSGIVSLKWPNDVLVPAFSERKLAGILVEVTPTPATTATGPDTEAGAFGAVIGMGMNLRRSEQMPDEVAQRAVTLDEALAGSTPGSQVSRDEMLSAYLRSLAQRLHQSADREATLHAYRNRCLTLGRQVRFETATGVVSGLAVDVDAHGALVVDDQEGQRHHLHSGDAHHV